MADLERSISSAYSKASERLFELFFNKFALMEHLRTLKDYLMLGKGDFVEILMEQLGFAPLPSALPFLSLTFFLADLPSRNPPTLSTATTSPPPSKPPSAAPLHPPTPSMPSSGALTPACSISSRVKSAGTFSCSNIRSRRRYRRCLIRSVWRRTGACSSICGRSSGLSTR
jgi:hypothetical protein